VTQPPAGDDVEKSELVRRLEVVEMQVTKLWDLFVRAARLDVSVDALRDEVRFLTSMWQQIQDNDEVLTATRSEVTAVQRTKADANTLRWTWVASAVAVVVLLAGMGLVGWAVKDVQGVARRQCVERQASLRATIARERDLAETDAPTARPAHQRSADAYQRLVHDC
jgi:hypothetical protein